MVYGYLCELSVIEQVRHVCQTTIVESAWRRGQALAVHGWIYDLRDGLIRDLRCTTAGSEEISSSYSHSLEQLSRHPVHRGHSG